MKSSEIMEILLDWNFWKKDIDTGVERQPLVENITRLCGMNEIVVVFGARRSGKSTLLLQFCKHLMGKGVRKEDLLIVNLEGPRLWELRLEQFATAFK